MPASPAPSPNPPACSAPAVGGMLPASSPQARGSARAPEQSWQARGRPRTSLLGCFVSARDHGFLIPRRLTPGGPPRLTEVVDELVDPTWVITVDDGHRQASLGHRPHLRQLRCHTRKSADSGLCDKVPRLRRGVSAPQRAPEPQGDIAWGRLPPSVAVDCTPSWERGFRRAVSAATPSVAADGPGEPAASRPGPGPRARDSGRRARRGQPRCREARESCRRVHAYPRR
jgi:hypothetical protein